MAADFLAVGHVVKDSGASGWTLGGSVAYASYQAHRLGLSSVAVTCCSPDVSPAEHLPHTQWHVLPDEQTTTFENRYDGPARAQRLIETARTIGPAQIPSAWRSTPIVLLAPVFHDVDVRAGSVFPPECLVGLSCQGWLRRLEGGRVRPGAVEPGAPWLIGDIVFVSEEDVLEPERVAVWLDYVPMVVLTRGPAGFTVFDDGGRHDFAPVPAREVDPTGAGDVLATAFLVRWQETQDLDETARFAAAASSLAVRGPGMQAIGSRAEIEALTGTAVVRGGS